MRAIRRSLITLLMVTGTPAFADDVSVLAAKFGALESIQQISLSPDGNAAAIISPRPSSGEVLSIVDLVKGGAPRGILVAAQKNERLRECNWASGTRLVCRIQIASEGTGMLLSATRLVSLNTDGSDVKLLSVNNNYRSLGVNQFGGAIIDWDLPNAPGTVLMMRQFVPETTTGSRMASTREGVGVEAVDTATLKRRIVEQPRREAVEYISDGHGTVRIIGLQSMDNEGRIGRERSYLFRAPGSREWQPLSVASNEVRGQGFDPYAVDGSKNVAYGFEDVNGFRALESITLDGTKAKQVVLARNDVDVDQLIRIGRDERVVGASYATERRTIEFFDPELKRLAAALGRALPEKPQVDFVDANAGETKLLLVAGSDAHPGMFYIYDKATRHLEEILPVRAQLQGIAMGTMSPVTFPTSDGTMVPGYLTLPPGSTGKNLPAIVMPHGGPGARDEWGFDWLVQFYAVRGFAVLQPNFRGSTGYGSAWYQKNGFQSWRIAVGDVNDAGRWLVSQGIAAPGKLGIVGWSYGGYAALQSSVLDPDLYKAIVAIAPVTDLERLRSEAANFTNSKLVDRFIGQGAHVRQGSPAKNADRIKAPVLLFHGDKDQNVGVGQSRMMADELRGAGKSVQYVEFSGLDHYLADPAARSRLLAESDAFLRSALGMTAK